jgi:Tfp pilus assembly protein PilN
MVKINLLVTRGGTFVYLSQLKVLVTCSVGMSLIILVVWHVFLAQKNAEEIKRKDCLQKELQLLETKIATNVNIKEKSQLDQEKATSGFEAVLEKKRQGLVKVFMALHQGTTSSLYFTQVSIKNDGVRLSGLTGSLSGLVPLISSFAVPQHDARKAVIQKITKEDGGYGFSLFFF